jgi:hypothetical protein
VEETVTVINSMVFHREHNPLHAGFGATPQQPKMGAYAAAVSGQRGGEREDRHPDDAQVALAAGGGGGSKKGRAGAAAKKQSGGFKSPKERASTPSPRGDQGSKSKRGNCTACGGAGHWWGDDKCAQGRAWAAANSKGGKEAANGGSN